LKARGDSLASDADRIASAMAESQKEQTATNCDTGLTDLEFNRKYTLEYDKLDREETATTTKFSRRESVLEHQLKKFNRKIHRLEADFEREQEQFEQRMESIQERRTKLAVILRKRF
jgi:TolA-binding protein